MARRRNRDRAGSYAGSPRAAPSQGRGPEIAGVRMVMGRNAVREVLVHQPERIDRMFFVRGDARDADFEALLERARSCGIVCEACERQSLEVLVGSDRHQAIAASLRPRAGEDLSEFLLSSEDIEEGLLVALDAIEDPHNLGSILRAAECFGAQGVLWSRNRGAQMSPVVAKVSCGASELVRVFEVANLAQSLRRARDCGWWIVGADVGPERKQLTSFVFPPKSLLVLGAEGAGLHRLVSEVCHEVVHIPLNGVIDSLNVGQAASIFLYEYRRQHRRV